MDALPHDLADRARAFLRGGLPPVGPRDAATVVLLRDGAPGTGPEVYLLRRAASMAFAPGQHVFPGGGVDLRDADEHAASWAGPHPATWASWLRSDPTTARALVCAAVRETFEESGVLLAGPTPEDVVADPTGPTWEADRAALLDRSVSLAELLRRRGLLLRSDLLRLWAHWITPEFEARRYDTRFFVAAVPEGQHARNVSGEADQAVWLPVRDAVAAYRQGALPMLPPTIVALRELAAYDTLAEVLEATVTVTAVLPRAVLDRGEVRLVVDGPDGVTEIESLVRVRA